MSLIPYSFYDLDTFFTPFENRAFQLSSKNIMSTDIVENENEIKLIMDIPGVKKENINITIEKGVLTVSASTQSESEEKDQSGNYVRRERSSGQYIRSFNVGENITADEVIAKLEDGTLTLTIPNNPEKKKESQTVKII